MHVFDMSKGESFFFFFLQHLAIKCGYFDRAATLGDVVQVYSGKHGRAMIFCQTKREADELATSADIKLECHVLHGDIPQDKRETVLKVRCHCVCSAELFGVSNLRTVPHAAKKVWEFS